MSPRSTSSSPEPSRSGKAIGLAMVIMPSWMVPTFSKMSVTCTATQPAAEAICQVSGIAMATMPTSIRPRCQSPMASEISPASISAFSICSDMNSVESMRIWRRKARVWASTTSRT